VDQKADQKADVEAAYRSHGDLVLRRARQILADESDAREALQEIFVSLLDDPKQLEGKHSLTAWLYTATTHHCLNVLRNRRTRLRLVSEHVAPMTASSVNASGEARAVVHQALAKLSDELARAAIYYYLDGMTHEEIAELLGYSRRHIGNLLEQIEEQVRK
jgi:RNA polymerase sigma-70 factor, ECF subfamily